MSNDKKDDVGKDDRLERKKSLLQQELTWAPPPHRCSWETPIPPLYFVKAVGDKAYSVFDTDDLVPHEQEDLVQDMLGDDVFQTIQSGDARACMSLCRPMGQIHQYRHLAPKKAMPTMFHQTGELLLEAMTLQQDRVRGMFATVACTEEFRRGVFHLNKKERTTVPTALGWLQKHNPWHQAGSSYIRWDWQLLTPNKTLWARVLLFFSWPLQGPSFFTTFSPSCSSHIHSTYKYTIHWTRHFLFFCLAEAWVAGAWVTV